MLYRIEEESLQAIADEARRMANVSGKLTIEGIIECLRKVLFIPQGEVRVEADTALQLEAETLVVGVLPEVALGSCTVEADTTLELEVVTQVSGWAERKITSVLTGWVAAEDNPTVVYKTATVKYTAEVADTEPVISVVGAEYSTVTQTATTIEIVLTNPTGDVTVTIMS